MERRDVGREKTKVSERDSFVDEFALAGKVSFPVDRLASIDRNGFTFIFAPRAELLRTVSLSLSRL